MQNFEQYSQYSNHSNICSGLNPSSIPHTLDGIANASDPLQAFADACGMSFKMDYLWIGNELVGATELGGSGLDLVNTGVDQGQADARLGDGNTCLFDASTDKMASAVDAALNVGVNSLAVINIHAFDSAAVEYVVSNYAIAPTSLGWRSYNNTSGHRVLNIGTSAGTFTATVAANHGFVLGQVDLLRRLTTTNLITIHTREGNASAAEATIASADGDGSLVVGNRSSLSFKGSWGLTAYKIGADAELVTPTHRSNLQAWLGLD